MALDYLSEDGLAQLKATTWPPDVSTASEDEAAWGFFEQWAEHRTQLDLPAYNTILMLDAIYFWTPNPTIQGAIEIYETYIKPGAPKLADGILDRYESLFGRPSLREADDDMVEMNLEAIKSAVADMRSRALAQLQELYLHFLHEVAVALNPQLSDVKGYDSGEILTKNKEVFAGVDDLGNINYIMAQDALLLGYVGGVEVRKWVLDHPHSEGYIQKVRSRVRAGDVIVSGCNDREQFKRLFGEISAKTVKWFEDTGWKT